jgi:sulfatase modifying factor 1
LLVLGLLGATMAGCNKQSASSDGAASSAGTSAGPHAVVTKSGVAMIALPSGKFTMGTADGNSEEGPPHAVTVSAFLIDKLEVNHEMLAKVQLPDPSHWQDNAKTPVERIRWRDAKAYCNERSRLEGLKCCYNEKAVEWDCDYSANGYRLPTEAEWEYAARAGADGAYDFGSADKLGQYAWLADNSDQTTHAGGQKRGNAWGIYDMDGNVSEWCEDVYSPAYYKESPSADPTGPVGTGKDVLRVMRGGSWKSNAESCRVTFRQGQRTGNTDACFATDFCGFRCVRRATDTELAQLSGPTQ